MGLVVLLAIDAAVTALGSLTDPVLNVLVRESRVSPGPAQRVNGCEHVPARRSRRLRGWRDVGCLGGGRTFRTGAYRGWRPVWARSSSAVLGGRWCCEVAFGLAAGVCGRSRAGGAYAGGVAAAGWARGAVGAARCCCWCAAPRMCSRMTASPDARGPSGGPSVAVWPDERARAFAASFARAYLSYSPRGVSATCAGSRRFMAPELVAGACPSSPGAVRIRSWRMAVPAGSVAAGGRSGVDHGRGRAGGKSGRAVSGGAGRARRSRRPGGRRAAVVRARARPRVAWRRPESEPLTGTDRVALEDVLGRFFRAYPGGRRGGAGVPRPGGCAGAGGLAGAGAGRRGFDRRAAG